MSSKGGDETLEATRQGLTLTVMACEDGVVVDADRQILAAVVGNLLQNAFKFTRTQSAVTLRVVANAERVRIELSLGLVFSPWGAEANNGQIHVRNLPERGCVFTVDLPRLRVSAAALV